MYSMSATSDRSTAWVCALCQLLDADLLLSAGGLYSVCYLRQDGGYLLVVCTLYVT